MSTAKIPIPKTGKYVVIATIELETTSKREADRLTKAVFGGIWDLMPEKPCPPASVVLFKNGVPLNMIRRI